nr:hypothetical protein [Staphylococcus sp. NRL 22/194]
MKSKAFTIDVLKKGVELFNIWSLIANQYEEINEKKLEEIISIGKSLERFNYIVLESLIRIVEQRIQNLKQKDQINYIEENLKIYLNNDWYIQSTNAYINLLWIINEIDSKRKIDDINEILKIKGDNLKITDELGKRIINKLQKDNFSLEIKTYDELMLNPGIKLIISLWEKDKITFGKRISNKLISLPLIQKIIIHRIVENGINNEVLIKELIKRIDKNYLFYDITVKNFIDEYSKKYGLNNKLGNCNATHFKNEISLTQAFWVKDKPFYSMDLDNLKYDEIEEKLIDAIKKKSYFKGENYFSLEGQNNELSNSFETSKQTNDYKKISLLI